MASSNTGMRMCAKLVVTCCDCRFNRAGSTALAQQLPAPSVHLMYFMAWTNLYQFVCNVALWWADLIPDFGMYAGGGLVQPAHHAQAPVVSRVSHVCCMRMVLLQGNRKHVL